MSAPRFKMAACPPGDVERLQRELQLSGPIAQVLVRRGMADPARARAFLAADEHHPPGAFAGIQAAIETIRKHLKAHSRITVHGDYDVDGVCSTAVLIRALTRLGGEVDWYLPERASDGYGLSADTVRRLAARGTRLLITADCAITAVQEVALARSLGIDVVITDHHAPRADGSLPDAPIVHPGMCRYPFRDLCATAVAHKLAEALWQAHARDPRELEEDLDLVALATIADVVPLLGENRALVRRGLRALTRTVKPGLRALMAVARVDPGRVDERSVAFALAPRLNAAGRMHTADAGLELMLTTDPERAARVAQELDRANHERRSAEQQIRTEAEAQIAALEQAPERRTLVLAGEGWHVGVIGIVASRLAERYSRPVVLIALEGAHGRGSARAGCEAFDLLAGLGACAAHLKRYGGHRAAAGLEIERERVSALANAFEQHARGVLSESDLAPLERVDAIVGARELGMALAEELRALGPFGQGNPPVALMVKHARLTDARSMGEGRHVRFTLLCPEGKARAVAFNTGGRLPVAEGAPVHATFALEVNEWKGVCEPRLVLRHARCAPHAPLEDQPATRAPAGRRARARASAQQELALFS